MRKRDKKIKSKAMFRINTRITMDQNRYIKRLASARKKTEGEILRSIIDKYIINE